MALPVAVSQQIQRLLDQASEWTKLVQAVQACMDCLKEHGLVWHQRLLPHHIGVHNPWPCSKRRFGVDLRRQFGS